MLQGDGNSIAVAAQVLRQMREKLRLNAAAVQVPIGLEDAIQGLVDLVDRRAYTFEGSSGDRVTGTLGADSDGWGGSSSRA